MGKILPFPAKKPSKFGFERVRKYTGGNQCQPGMSHTDLGKVLRLPTNISPFEEALLLDECGDSRAEKAYRRAISEGDLAADAYCNLGIIESKAGRITKAFDCFTKSLEHNPRHFESHYNLGNLYFEVDNLRRGCIMNWPLKSTPRSQTCILIWDLSSPLWKNQNPQSMPWSNINDLRLLRSAGKLRI